MLFKYKRFFIYIFLPLIIFTSANYVCGPDKPTGDNKKCVNGCVVKTSRNLVDTLISGTALDLYSASFPGPGVGYISGENGAILKTMNGGTNWFAQTSGTGADLKGIFAIDADTVIAVGKSGYILRTTNKGMSWDSLFSKTAYDLNSVHFPDRDTGYICGNNGKLLRSNNSGRTWDTLSSGTYSNLYCINFTNATTGVAVGPAGATLQTTNAGNNWTIINNGPGDLYGVDFLKQSVFAVGAGGKIMKSTNNGAAWVNETSPTTDTLNSVIWCMTKLAYAVGRNGVNLRYNGVSWQTGPAGTSEDQTFLAASLINRDSMQTLPSPVITGFNGTIIVNNNDSCNGPLVTATYVESEDSCYWCIDYRSNGFTIYPIFLITCSGWFNEDYCEPGDMNVIGTALHEQTTSGQISGYDISNYPAYRLRLNIHPGFNKPSKFKFYLYNNLQAEETSCYIELDDIMCCDPCNP